MKKLFLLIAIISSQTLWAQKGEMIFFPLIGNPNFAAAYMVRAKNPGKKVLFIFHEWWGLNDNIKNEAETYAAEMPDVTVYAIDLFDGDIASDETNARKFMNRLTPQRVQEIISGIIGYAGTDKHIAIIGLGMGSIWSLQAAIQAGKKAKACVMYYGSPESDFQKLKSIRCPVLGILGTQDTLISAVLHKSFEANRRLRKKLIVYHYDAIDAFANPANPNYNHEFAKDAHAKVLVFLRQYLK